MKVHRALVFSIYVTSPHLNAAFHCRRNFKFTKLSKYEESSSSASARSLSFCGPGLRGTHDDSQSSDHYLSAKIDKWVEKVYSPHSSIGHSISDAELWLLGTVLGIAEYQSPIYQENEMVISVAKKFRKSKTEMSAGFKKSINSAIKQLSQVPGESNRDLAIIADYFQMIAEITGYRNKHLSELEYEITLLIMPLRPTLQKLLTRSPNVELLLKPLEKKMQENLREKK